MPGFHGGDSMGLLIDWLDACKERRFSSLVDLYDEAPPWTVAAGATPCADVRIGSVLGTQAGARRSRKRTALPRLSGLGGTPVRMHFRVT